MSTFRAAGAAAVSCLTIGLAAAGMAGAAAEDQAGVQPVSFNRDIRPILSNNCFACHGPDEKQRETKFHFDTEEGAFLENGVIVRGAAAKSLLYKKITDPDPDERMPPPDSGHSLTDKQIALLQRWIDEGAKWDVHWAYSAPVRPDPPMTQRSDWARNPIDQFVLARLEREGLKPSREADKTALLRRVTYDLTGLPPTPAEIDAFLADKSDDAYEKRVDKLLQSPHYGERMAMPWLDASRFADTHGYHIDSHRDMWPWRDWVIGAFNKNLPFDQFTIEQLAGDLLPNATRDQKVASGFNRNHIINYEGGAIAEEYQVEYVIDRVEATSSAFMGLTMGCARCHSHKYDPITHKEFYQFYAFFNNVPELGLDGKTGNAEPVLLLPSDAQQAKLDELNRAIEAREAALSDEAVGPLQIEWEKTITVTPAGPGGAPVAYYELDGNLSDVSGRYQNGRTVAGDPTFEPGQVGRALSFDGDTEVSFGNVGEIDSGGRSSVALWLRGDGNKPTTILEKVEGEQGGRGYRWQFEDIVLVGIQKWAARLTITLKPGPTGHVIQLRTRDRLNMSDWHHVVLTFDGSAKKPVVRLYVDGKARDLDASGKAPAEWTGSDPAFRVGGRGGGAFSGQIDDLRLYDRVLTEPEIEQLAVHHAARVVISGVTGKRTKEQAESLRDYYLTYAAPEAMRTTHSELKGLRTQRAEFLREIPTAMVMAERPEPRETFVLARGDYRNKTDKVAPGVPAMLPPLPKNEPRNRLTLAKWLVRPEHPLTSRVAVNRFWQSYFGTGIVKTQEDFGVQGDPPSHPELLDWLASEFIRTGWDVRAMQRLIVTSATYRQESKITEDLREKDPENRLLARGPRTRLPAEMIRDTALATSGLLNAQIGGPSVRPYQPPGLWEEMAFGEGFSAQTYEPSHGKDLYRRGMYTFWKRTVPPASLALFDAPDREKCTARRALTNTPLQALTLMNDPTYVEAARALAQRTMLEGGKDENDRISYAFRLATARKPSRKERKVLRQLLEGRMAEFTRDRQSAAKLIAVGESRRDRRLDVAELAAWTMVTSAILNLDETITKQ